MKKDVLLTNLWALTCRIFFSKQENNTSNISKRTPLRISWEHNLVGYCAWDRKESRTPADQFLNPEVLKSKPIDINVVWHTCQIIKIYRVPGPLLEMFSHFICLTIISTIFTGRFNRSESRGSSGLIRTMSTANSDDSSDKNVEIWKVKKLIKSLQMARGNGTSMISLIIPPGDQVRVLPYTFSRQMDIYTQYRL